MRWRAMASRPEMHLAWTRSRTAALLPAQWTTRVGSTPTLNQVDRQAWRRSQGLRASGDTVSASVTAAARAAAQKRQ